MPITYSAPVSQALAVDTMDAGAQDAFFIPSMTEVIPGSVDPLPVGKLAEPWLVGGRALLMIPIFPLLGYFLLDATGVTAGLRHASPILNQILGEGFGHVGLCFSLHYFINALKSFGRGIRLMLETVV